MPNIRLDLDGPIVNGQTLTFKSPIDCSEVTGLKVYYPVSGVLSSKTFAFADAHGKNVGSKDLFAENVLVKVILDTELRRAYVQNADTNAYLESKFAGKAPSGFGLGSQNKWIADSDDIDNLIYNGWYSYGGGNQSANKPFDYGDIFVSHSRTGGFRQQIASKVGPNPQFCIRNMQDDEWKPWAWVNPPMEVGVEYRTIEKYQGSTVFRKLVEYEIHNDLGTTSTTTTSPLAHGISNFRELVRCNATAKNGTLNCLLPFISSKGGISSVVGITDTNVILCNSNVSWPAGTIFMFDLSYTK